MGVGGASPVTEQIAEILDRLPGGASLADTIEFVVAWARANSLWPLVYGTACCAMEMMSAGSSRHDWARFGVEVARATPRQADLIVLAGTIVEKMAQNLVTLYEQMPGPKYVIAMGSCAISGGPFYYDSYSVIKGGDRLVPVDVYIPGCPPRPEALLYGIMELQKKIRTEGRKNPWRVGTLFREPFIDTHSFARSQWEKRNQDETAPTAEQPRPGRLEKTTFPEVAAQKRPRPGLDNAGLLAAIHEAFPDLTAVADTNGDRVLELAVNRDHYLDLAAFLRDDPRLKLDLLLQITAVDWRDRFDLLVQLLSTGHGHKIFLRLAVDRDRPSIASLCPLFLGAEWHEREVFDLFGIQFTGHPDLRRIFLMDNFPGHPLRKDFDDPARVLRRPY
ncbi:MAG: hypothetical protein A2505_07445 [Deltaproteobacteria bacterium RIFOXYD12_FULL_55_16]|nr:MAG: hypothetical protein A2505_07445 [Deltaproteobacteria bacterium RIFOXYD12_FULL_55_16]